MAQKNSIGVVVGIVIVVIILLLIVFAVMLAGKPSSTSPSSTSSPGATNQAVTGSPAVKQTQFEVTYTDDGFNPASLRIKAGDTVEFINQSSGDMWVASNPHPTHTDYPGFDALKSYAPGSSYLFTFTKTGSWGYHNHLNPAQGGTIIVQ